MTTSQNLSKLELKNKIDHILEEVMEGVFGTKNRVELILLLEDLKKSL